MSMKLAIGRELNGTRWSFTMFANMIPAEDDVARVLAGAREGVIEEAGPNVKVDWRPVANGCWRIT